MLELRVTRDTKRLAMMRDAIVRECLRLDLGNDHARTVAFVAERLVGDDDRAPDGRPGRRAEAFVILTVQSDATMLMVRENAPSATELGYQRERLLQAYTARWSTMSSNDGRTVWAEIARRAGPAPTPDHDSERRAPAPGAPRPPAVTRASRPPRPMRARLGNLLPRAVPASASVD